jgi:hypothetical protein
LSGEYRFVLRDGADPPGEMTLVCLDDEAALLMAERFAVRHPVEVWEGQRRVGVGAPPLPAAPAAAPRRRFWHGAWKRGG